MIKKLRIKFVAIIMTIVTIMLCIIFALVLYFTRANLENESLNMLKNIAASPFHLILPNSLEGDVRLPYFAIQIGVQGELLATSGGYYDLSDTNFLQNLVDTALSSPKAFGVIEKYSLRYYKIQTPINQCIAFGDISSEQATITSLTRSCILIGFFSFFALLAISIFLSKWAVIPLEKAWKQQHQFIADASHELKTPLSIILTNAEIAQNEKQGEEIQGLMQNITSVSNQMKGLIEQLLMLASWQTPQGENAFEKVCLSYELAQECLLYECVFFENNLAFFTNINKNIYVSGNEKQLRQVLSILLDNAKKYAAKNSGVEVLLYQKSKKKCVLSVTTEGTPLSPQEQKDVFTRFYRVDTSRSKSGSYGLGLAIAKEIVTNHHGTIWAQSGNGQNVFCVELPCLQNS